MALQLKPGSMACENPPYAVVEGCERVGIVRAPDVRWRRVNSRLSKPRGWLGHRSPRFGAAWPRALKQVACVCGQQSVWLLKYRFTFDTGEQLDYRNGQCARCLTVHWDNG